MPWTVEPYSFAALSWQVAQSTGLSFSGCGSFWGETSAWQSVHLRCISPCTDRANVAPSTAIDLPAPLLASLSPWHARQVSLTSGAAAAARGAMPAASTPRKRAATSARTRRNGSGARRANRRAVKGSSLAGPESDRRRRDVHDPPEELADSPRPRTRRRAGRRVRRTPRRSLPSRRASGVSGEGQDFLLLAASCAPSGTSRRPRRRRRTPPPRHRLPAGSARAPARARGSSARRARCSASSRSSNRPRLGTAGAQAQEQVAVFLRMVEALRKGVEVIDHRAQHVERRLHPAIADLAHEMEHAVQHRRQGAVFVLDDADRPHLPSPMRRSAALPPRRLPLDAKARGRTRP